MGGDGGTLNNSRHELTRLRQSLLRAHTPAVEKALARARASTTHCALSHLELRPPHVVVDRLGNLYNKPALLAHLLERASGPRSAAADALPHIRSLKRDVAPVSLTRPASASTSTSSSTTPRFVCPVSRKDVLPDANCSVGWLCGCVTAPLHHHSSLLRARDTHPQTCLHCGRDGPRVVLGQTRSQRDALMHCLREQRAARHEKKKRGRPAHNSDVNGAEQRVATEGAPNEDARETPRATKVARTAPAARDDTTCRSPPLPNAGAEELVAAAPLDST